MQVEMRCTDVFSRVAFQFLRCQVFRLQPGQFYCILAGQRGKIGTLQMLLHSPSLDQTDGNRFGYMPGKHHMEKSFGAATQKKVLMLDAFFVFCMPCLL